MLQRGRIEERLDIGTDLATRLIDPVEFGEFEAEAANHCFQCPIFRVHGNQRGVHIRDLSQQQLFALFPYPDLGADFQHIARRFWGIALTVVGNKGAGPFNAVPAELCFLAILQYQRGAAITELGHDRRHQRVVSGLFAKVSDDLLVIPGCLASLPQLSRRAAIAVAHIIGKNAIQQRLSCRPLTFGRDGSVYVQAHGVGIFTELLHHLLAHHFPQIGGVQGHFGAVKTGLDRHFGRFVKLGLGDLASFQHPAQHNVAARKGAFGGADGVEHGGGFRQTGNDGDLVQSQILDLFTKVNLCRSTDPEGAITEGDLVEVEFEDLVF